MACHSFVLLNPLLKANNLNFVRNAVPCVQCVRFKKTPRRKPISMPVAKSKEFYVREPTPIDPVEHKELEIRYENYRAAVRGIRSFLRQEFSKRVIVTSEKKELNIAADFDWMENEIKAWNAKIAESREKRQTEECDNEQKRIAAKMQEQAEIRLQRVIKAEDTLHREKIDSVHFVTSDNLDLEIEKMLDGRNDYNFAVTVEGEVLPGEFPEDTTNNPVKTAKSAS